MRYTNINLEDGLKKEWIITNGIGGYASSTLVGANTRRYHGLLVAPLTPPARRHLILSKLDESIEIDDKQYNLYTNICKDYVSRGYKYITSFEKEYIPIHTYEVDGVKIKKYICMEYGKNTVIIYYQINNKNVRTKLTLTPIINFRDFHSMSTDYTFNINQKINDKKVKVVIDDNVAHPIYMKISEGFREFESLLA